MRLSRTVGRGGAGPRFASLLAAGMAAALVLTACGGSDSDDDDSGGADRASPGFEDCDDDPVNCNSGERVDGGEITWALSAGWETWNTNQAAGNSVYLVQALQGLLPETGRFLPDGQWSWNMDLLAEEPKLLSDEPQSYQYVLREEAVWNDGTPISGEDFIWHWYSMSGEDSLCTGGCDTADTTYAGQVDGIVQDGQAITITLKDGEVDPEWMFATPISYPAHVAEREAPGWKDDPDQMAASVEYFAATPPDYSGGPYLIDDYTPSEQVIKVPNPEWYGKTKPTLDKVIQAVVPDQQAMLTAVQNGEISGSTPASLDPDVAEQAADLPGVYSRVGPGPSWEHIDIMTEHEWLQDRELRRAILTAIDVDEINSRTYGQVTPNVERRTNPLWPNGSEFHEDKVTASGLGSGDLDTANQILTDAGYEIVDGKLTKDGEAAPAIRFSHLEGHTMRRITAEMVQAQLAEIGIEIQLVTIPTAELSSTLGEGNFDMIIFGNSGTPTFTTSPNYFWHSQSTGNRGRNKNPDIDAAIAKVRQTTDLTEAAGYANDVVELMIEDAFQMPLVSTPVLIVASDKYVNIRDTWASSYRAMYNMEEWGLAEN